MLETRGRLPNRDTTTRNLSIDLTDGAVEARLRGRPGHYRLTRQIGRRGVSVRRRMATKGWLAQVGGVALIAVGLGMFLLGFFTDIRLAGGQPVALMLAGGQAMILGTGLYCYQQLLIRSMQNEEALKFQYDIGYEAGWRDGENQTKPVVVEFPTRRTANKVSDRV